jgi:hypothetical protein
MLAAWIAATTPGTLMAQEFSPPPVPSAFSPAASDSSVPPSNRLEGGPGESVDYQKEMAVNAQTPAASANDLQKSRMISIGQSAFQNRCIQCHDADKSLQKSKGVVAWRATIARMARQDGADIPQSDWEPIAAYLASLAASSGVDTSGSEGTELDMTKAEAPEVTVFGTVSPTLRTHGTEIQNPGFFGDVWAGVAWEPNNGPLSAKMVACVSCHNEHDEGYLSRLEIVQASLTLNLGQLVRGDATRGRSKSSGGGLCTGCGESNCLPPSRFAHEPATDPQIEAFVEAGRMVVPFGAFSSQVNPGVYRTVSRPLMFNMGQRVYDENIGDPVLPMPYSDEGADLNIIVPLFDNVTMGIDAYVVNGLQGSNNISFDDSRDYVDNNRSPAVGGRWTVGNSTLRLGSSIIGGQFNSNSGTGPDNRGLDFLICGADVSYRFRDILRIQAEFAQRRTQSYYDFAAPLYAKDRVSGWYLESELLLSRDARLSALMRWDQQGQRYGAFDPGSALPSSAFDVNRLTYGINWTVPGGSLLMLNIEHWFLPNGLNDMNVVGARWAVSF